MAALRMLRERENEEKKERKKRERLLPDCPGTQKKKTFFISYLAYKKKRNERKRGGMLGKVKRSEKDLSGNLLGGLWAGLRLKGFLQEKSQLTKKRFKT